MSVDMCSICVQENTLAIQMTTIVYNLIGSLVDQTQPLGYKIDANALKLYDYFTLPVCKNKLTSDELSICKNKREKSTRTPI